MDVDTSFEYRQAMLLCNEGDATISKVAQAMPQPKNARRQVQILAVERKEKYRRKRNGWPMQNTSTATGRRRYFGVSPKFVTSPLFLLNAREVPARVCSLRRT